MITESEALQESTELVQLASQTRAAEALNSLAVRFSAGTDQLSQHIRKDQDLAAEAESLDKKLLAAVSAEPSKRDPAAEQKIRDRIIAVTNGRSKIQEILATDFPDYISLSKPKPLTIATISSLLASDEAIVVVYLGAKSYVWAFTGSQAEWRNIDITETQASNAVSKLRAGLDFNLDVPFDAEASFSLYRSFLGPVENIIRGKRRLSFVMNGALTSLPPQVLVTADPTGKELKDVDWLMRIWGSQVTRKFCRDLP